ncbi:hypothetical protein Leryth_016026 [Lithospermum erythrorhizon]|nr:hypothetical protein Leryth_016026 [Lithospermum erythrorhizon]
MIRKRLGNNAAMGKQGKQSCLPGILGLSLGIWVWLRPDPFSPRTMAKSSGESYDLLRTSRMAGYGLLLLGPTLHYWFNFVSKILPKRDLVSTLKKMALAQTIYGPFMTVVFFSGNAALQGERGDAIIARLKRDLKPTMINGVMYWPLCDFITFKFVPVHLQPLVSNSFSYIWNVYMTYMASLEKAD